MESANGRRRQARNGQVLSITALVAVLAIALGVVTVVTVYLNRVSATVAALTRTEPLAGYDGRPPAKPALSPGASAPVDYLLTVAGEDDSLLSVHLLRLSGDRRHLTMIGIPSDLVPNDPGQPNYPLATSWALGRDEVARQVEVLFGIRTDHQITVGLDGVSHMVDALGGLSDLTRGDAQNDSDGRALLRYVAAAPDGPGRVARVSDVAQALIQRLGVLHAVSNPAQFDQVLKAIESCTLVDSNLTASDFESTLMESGVRADEMGLIELPTVQADERTALPQPLAELRQALAADTLDQLATPVPEPGSPSVVR